MIFFARNESLTLFITSQSILIKKAKVILLGVFLSTTDNYVTKTNIHKNIISEEQQTYLTEKYRKYISPIKLFHIGSDDFPHLL